MLKATHTPNIDTAGLQKAVTALAIAAGLAGWAVLARPDTSVAIQAATQLAPSGLRVVTAPQAGLRVVTAAPAPVTSTRASR